MVRRDPMKVMSKKETLALFASLLAEARLHAAQGSARMASRAMRLAYLSQLDLLDIIAETYGCDAEVSEEELAERDAVQASFDAAKLEIETLTRTRD